MAGISGPGDTIAERLPMAKPASHPVSMGWRKKPNRNLTEANDGQKKTLKSVTLTCSNQPSSRGPL